LPDGDDADRTDPAAQRTLKNKPAEQRKEKDDEQHTQADPFLSSESHVFGVYLRISFKPFRMWWQCGRSVFPDCGLNSTNRLRQSAAGTAASRHRQTGATQLQV